MQQLGFCDHHDMRVAPAGVGSHDQYRVIGIELAMPDLAGGDAIHKPIVRITQVAK
jgi:hypothetical protein